MKDTLQPVHTPQEVIEVVSDTGQGTKFMVRLPVDRPREAPRQSQPAKTPDDTDAKARGRLLVVDDEAMLLKMLKRILSSDHEVVTATSGIEAREILTRDTDFDLILCDMMMPEMSGMDLHEWLRQREEELASRMVFMTGGTFTARSAEFYHASKNQRLSKPFSSPQVRDLVQSILVKQRDHHLEPRRPEPSA